MKLLIIEEDKKILSWLMYVLNKDYYIDSVDNLKDGLDYGISGMYNCVLLGEFSNTADSLQVINKLRNTHVCTPVLYMLKKENEEMLIESLKTGADDCVLLPISSNHLNARITALLRRQNNYIYNNINFSNVVLDNYSRKISYNKNDVNLVTKEFQILELFFKSPGQIISIEQIIHNVWGLECDVDSGLIWVYISAIRKKLKSINSPINISTLRNVGYKLSIINQ